MDILKDKKYIIKKMRKIYGKDRVLVISTKGYDFTRRPRYGRSDKERNMWMDKIVCPIYGVDRNNIVKESRAQSSGEYNFSYIKFGVNVKSRKSYGIVSGKSSFHKNYASDVWFYKFEKNKKVLLEDYMKDNGLEWDVEEIVILKNKDSKDANEAYVNEKILKNKFGLFD